jgi:hypothetical protein
MAGTDLNLPFVICDCTAVGSGVVEIGRKSRIAHGKMRNKLRKEVSISKVVMAD